MRSGGPGKLDQVTADADSLQGGKDNLHCGPTIGKRVMGDYG